MSTESYAHRAAKDVVLGWLRGAAANPLPAPFFPDVACCAELAWRVNGEAPHYGVWGEYPVLRDGTGIEPVWDEAGWYNDAFRTFPDDRPPSFDELTAIGCRPAAILDVAVQHKGRIVIGIEIFHKNRCSPSKISFLHGHDLGELLEIPASWVLGQVDKPRFIPDEFWLLPRNRPNRAQREAAIRYLERIAQESIQA